MNSNIAGVHHSRRMIILVLSLIVAAVGNLSSTPVEGRVLLDDHSGFSQSLRRLMMNSGEEGSSAVTSAAGSGVEEGGGTKWAVLVAGSNGFGNYRHQADICHAYQILKKGGLKDENIVVMMYDDIANNPENPTKGVIINRPDGEDVYQGVPKDYTGEEVTAENLLAVILGDASGVQGGSGKVVNSSPNDHIFIYYADHGAPGVLAMPDGDTLYASDFIDTLKKKYASGTYKTMVIYMEACEAGSIFDGILPEGMNIYVTTASNPKESSYGTYCSQEQYQTCLGDLYSVSWMEDRSRDCDERMGTTETLEEQYEVVKERTKSSHVMQYGDSNMANDPTSLYMGAGGGGGGGGVTTSSSVEIKKASTPLVTVDQREADILYLRQKVDRAPQDSHEQVEAQKQLDEAIAQRARVDHNVAEIGERLFGAMNAEETLNKVRPVGQPLVDDWDCLKSLVAAYKTRCGSLSSYGMKYMRAFANMCNAGIQKDKMTQALSQTCS